MCERITHPGCNERAVPTRVPPLCRPESTLLANQQDLQPVGAEGVKAAKLHYQSSWMTELDCLIENGILIKRNLILMGKQAELWLNTRLVGYKFCLHIRSQEVGCAVAGSQKTTSSQTLQSHYPAFYYGKLRACFIFIANFK